jgi:hypothetical protein
MSTREQRSEFMWCNCGAAFRVVNAAVEVTSERPRCADCADFGTLADTQGTEYLDELVSTELGWCGCGQPWKVDDMMVAYLTARARPEFPKPRPDGMSEDTETLLSYIADDLGWTEHGGSVEGAWLSDDGKTALANLQEAKAVRDGSRP